MSTDARAVPSSRMIDGHISITTSLEPDGRVRVEVASDGEVLAAPTFSAEQYRAAQGPILVAVPAALDMPLTELADRMEVAAREHAEAAVEAEDSSWELRAEDLKMAREYSETTIAIRRMQAQRDEIAGGAL
jgi:hypothetical protein